MAGASDRTYEDVSEAKVVIVGGGIIGLSVAYHLAKLDWSDVLLLERNQLTSGTSWHAAGIVGPLRASLNLTKLAIYATELFPELEAETGQSTGYRQTGGLWLAQTEARVAELRRIAAMGTYNGLDVRMLRREDLAATLALLRVDDLLGGLWVTEDGQTNPVDTCMAYAKGAKKHGVRIREGTSVLDIQTSRGGVYAVDTGKGSRIRCEYVVNCAGLWAREVGAMVDAAIPLQAVEHMYVVTEPVDGLPVPFPIVRDLDGGIYVKEDAGKLVLGGFESDAKLWDSASVSSDSAFLTLSEDWEQFEPFLVAGLDRIPLLQNVGIQHFMNGPESFTPDTRQVMGEVPGIRNYFVAAGFNSIGIMSSAGVGKAMAEWIIGGEPPMDLWEVDIARFEPHTATRAFLTARTAESVCNQFDMHWPHKQMRTARGIRRSALHELFAKAGAVFGAPTGWERPLWFAQNAGEREQRYSFHDQPWRPYAEREAMAVRDGVALFELSPFTKIRVEGRDAETLLQRLCTSNVAVEPGRVIYTQMLNRRGGIEADLTVTRIDEEVFWVVSGAATRVKDLTWMRRGLAEDEHVAISDLTSAYGVIGVMGPHSRRLLQAVSNSDLSPDAFPFGTSRQIDIGSALVRASRISFVGELGWELYIPTEFAPHVYRALSTADEALGVAHAGHYCLDACRLEKGFRHWGHDMGSEDSPLEAGLSFTLAFDKPVAFVGRDAVLRSMSNGIHRHLLLFAVEGSHPLIVHDEPVYRDGMMAGLTTSGTRGFRTERSLCFAYIAVAPGEVRSDLLGSRYEIEVAGERYPLAPLSRAPYDPVGARMRA